MLRMLSVTCSRYKNSPLLFWAIGLSLAIVSPFANADDCKSNQHSHKNGLADDQIIGRIEIHAGNLFDLKRPDQSEFVHTAANALHIVTREKTILDALPFRSGETFSAELLREGERVLRSRRYIRDATLTAVRTCSRRVDVEVHTIDNWTLTPSISFGHAGGDNRYAFEIQDLNVLGSGKEVKIRQSHKAGVKSSNFIYGDDNVFGSHHKFRLEIGETDDGDNHSLVLGLPFYSKNSGYSWQIALRKNTSSFSVENAEEFDIPVQTEMASLQLSSLQASTKSTYTRTGLGIRVDRQSTDISDNNLPDPTPADFEEVYPFVTGSWKSERWVKRQNYQSLKANEDIDLGLSLDLELGIISQNLDNANNALRLEFEASKSWTKDTRSLHKFALQQTHYLGSDAPKKYALSARYQHFRWLNETDQLDLRLTGETRRGYSPLHDYSIGGADGLRAYSTDEQMGENRVLGLAEYRHITPWSPWSLANIAVSLFIEAGQAWDKDDTTTTLADAGFGLQLSPTRSSRAAINRFDVAFPLVKGPDVSGYQLFVGTKINF